MIYTDMLVISLGVHCQTEAKKVSVWPVYISHTAKYSVVDRAIPSNVMTDYGIHHRHQFNGYIL